MRCRIVAFVLVAVVLAAPCHAQDEKKPLALDDLYRLDSPGGVVPFPDGKSALYVRQTIDAVSRQERFALWTIDADSGRTRQFERDELDGRAPVFSPDGNWVAFLSTRPRPNDWKQTPPAGPGAEPAVDIWLKSTQSGDTIPLAGPAKPYGRVFNDGFYGRVAFSPDSKKLAFVADDGKDSRTPEEIDADVIEVRPDQGEGYTGYRPAQVWVAHLDKEPGKFAARRIERLTNDDVWYGDPQWSPDGRTVVVHANRTKDRESVRYSINKEFNLYAIDVEKHTVEQLTKGAGPVVSPRFSPDGKRLACLSVPRKGSHRDVFNLTLVTLGDGGPRTEVLFDHHGPDAAKAPHRAPSFPLPEDCWDGDGHFCYRAEVGTGGDVVRVDVKTGKGTSVKLPPDAVEPAADSFAGRLLRRRLLTPPSNLFLRERLLGESRVVKWKNEGLDLDGILTVPHASVAKAPYKLILYPHGGPHSRSALGFDFTVQTFAAHGYAVFQPNFRGSSGYSQKFIEADRNDLGGGDMRDILTGVDHLVKEKVIDRDRQFVYGTSYGGFMTCWLVGHTKQFRAAVAQNAVTDLNVMWSLSDLQSWTEWEFGGKPWDVPGAMRKHSPLTYIAEVRTPTMILHSRDDRRCPLPMGQMFYQGLKAREVPTRMVIYPNEGHGIRQPKHRVDVLRRTLTWFEEHDAK